MTHTAPVVTAFSFSRVISYCNNIDLLQRVGNVLERALAADAQHDALVTVDGSLNYEELDQAVDRAATALAVLGVKRNDVIAVSLPNASDVVVTFHAVMRLGAVWLGVNRNLAPPEKHFILRDSGARLLLASPDVEATLGWDSDAALPIPIVVLGADDGVWQDTVESAPSSYRRPVCRATDAAGIAYTSGTTGRPKGVMHSHRNLLLPGAMVVEARRLGPELRKGDCAALTILNLQVTSTLLVAQAGGTQVVMDRVDPLGVAQWVKRASINSWFGVPTILQGLSASSELDVEDLATLHDVWTGGTYLPEPTRRSFEERFGCRVSATYGLTEAPTIVTIEDVADDRVPGSSGSPLQHLLVEIRDKDRVLPVGETGEITVRAREDGPYAGVYQPMLGYLGHPKATSQAVRNGVLYTGDIGYLDEAGRLFVRDRRNALILRGGANVYPAEVERVLLEAPGVRGVSVIGVPDDRLGQRVAAAIEPEVGLTLMADTLASYCASQLARYKVPELWRIGTLPRNAMGKVIRTELEEWFSASGAASAS
jgi:long-chain acyl-CoA synthetase